MGNQGLYRGRPEVNGDMIQRFTTVDSSKEVVVVVCPYSTGCVIVQEIQRRGYKVIALWPKGFSDEMKSHIPVSCGTMQYYAVETVGDDSGETSRELYKAAGAFKIVGCICGGEAGVDLADVMSELLLVRTNGAALNRRNKRVQQEVIKNLLGRHHHQHHHLFLFHLLPQSIPSVHNCHKQTYCLPTQPYGKLQDSIQC